MAILDELLAKQKELDGANVPDAPPTPALSVGQEGTSGPTGAGNGFVQPDVYTDAEGRLHITVRPFKQGEIVSNVPSRGQGGENGIVLNAGSPTGGETGEPTGTPQGTGEGGGGTSPVAAPQPQPQQTAQGEPGLSPGSQTQPQPTSPTPGPTETIQPAPPTTVEASPSLDQLIKLRDSVPAQPVGEPGQSPDTPLFNAMAGANKVVAHVLGTPQELVDSTLRMTGIAKLAPNFFNQNPGDALKQMEGYFNRIGIYTTPGFEGFASKVGDEAAKGIFTTAAMIAAAPAAAGVHGAGMTASITRWLGEALVQHPYLAMFQVPGSAVGAVGGSEISPHLAIPGAILGGGVSSLLESGARGVARLGANTLSKLYSVPASGPKNLTAITDALLPPVKNTGAPSGIALRDVLADPGRATAYAEQQVEGARLHMEQAVRDAITKIRPTSDPATSQSNVRTLLEKAERIGNIIVSRYWQRVPLQTRVPLGGIREDIGKLSADLKDTPSAAPREFIDRIKNMVLVKRNEKGQIISPPLPTIKRMRDLQGEIRRARMAEEGKAYVGMPVNDALVRNYNRLASIIDNGIMESLPGDTRIAQARAVSIMYHDLFSRGNIADVLARRARGDNKFRPDQTVDELMGRHQGLEDLMNVPRAMSGPGGQPSLHVTQPKGPPLKAAARQVPDQLVQEAENSLRGMFREAANEHAMDPAKVAGWIKKNEPQIRHMASVASDLDQTAQKLTAVVEQRKLLERSAVARFAEMDPQKAIQRVWNDANPAATSKELIKTFKGDTEALEGYRAGLLDELFTRTKIRADRMKDMLDQPKVRRLMEATLSPEQFARLEKMTNTAHSIARGDQMSMKQHFLPSVSIIGRIFAASIGGRISRLFGSSTIQGPGIMAQYAKGAITKAFKGYDADYMLQRAVMDPNWERLLYSRVPETPKELAQTVRFVKQIVRSEVGGRTAVDSELAKQSEPQKLSDNKDMSDMAGIMKSPYIRKNVFAKASDNFDRSSNIEDRRKEPGPPVGTGGQFIFRSPEKRFTQVANQLTPEDRKHLNIGEKEFDDLMFSWKERVPIGPKKFTVAK